MAVTETFSDCSRIGKPLERDKSLRSPRHCCSVSWCSSSSEEMIASEVLQIGVAA